MQQHLHTSMQSSCKLLRCMITETAAPQHATFGSLGLFYCPGALPIRVCVQMCSADDV
jgi:hypothetical protein